MTRGVVGRLFIPPNKKIQNKENVGHQKKKRSYLTTSIHHVYMQYILAYYCVLDDRKCLFLISPRINFNPIAKTGDIVLL
jgi:hypothetical protein